MRLFAHINNLQNITNFANFTNNSGMQKMQNIIVSIRPWFHKMNTCHKKKPVFVKKNSTFNFSLMFCQEQLFVPVLKRHPWIVIMWNHVSYSSGYLNIQLLCHTVIVSLFKNRQLSGNEYPMRISLRVIVFYSGWPIQEIWLHAYGSSCIAESYWCLL